MSRWDELVQAYERSIVEHRPSLALQLLSELTLTAPASAVRRYHADLVKISRQCRDPRIRDQLIVTLELLRQRATITDSSLNVRSKAASGNVTSLKADRAAGGPERRVQRPGKKEKPVSSRSRGSEGAKRGNSVKRTPSPSGRDPRSG